jgi:hypothetical protein
VLAPQHVVQCGGVPVGMELPPTGADWRANTMRLENVQSADHDVEKVACAQALPSLGVEIRLLRL